MPWASMRGPAILRVRQLRRVRMARIRGASLPASSICTQSPTNGASIASVGGDDLRRLSDFLEDVGRGVLDGVEADVSVDGACQRAHNWRLRQSKGSREASAESAIRSSRLITHAPPRSTAITRAILPMGGRLCVQASNSGCQPMRERSDESVKIERSCDVERVKAFNVSFLKKAHSAYKSPRAINDCALGIETKTPTSLKTYEVQVVYAFFIPKVRALGEWACCFAISNIFASFVWAAWPRPFDRLVYECVQQKFGLFLSWLLM